MAKKPFTKRDKTRFTKLNKVIKEEMEDRIDTHPLYINYNDLIDNPKNNIEKVLKFIEVNNVNINKMIDVIDKSLYREKKL
jgi:hypothetical protein